MPDVMPLRPTNLPPLEHWNYDELEACPCFLCVRYRTLQEAAQEARIACDGMRQGKGTSYVPDHPDWEKHQQAHRAYLAASARRDLYSELSFLTRGQRWQRPFLHWVLRRILNPDFKREGWWAFHCSDYTLGSWITEWEQEQRSLLHSRS